MEVTRTMPRLIVLLTALLCAFFVSQAATSRPLGHRGPGAGGAFDPRGVHDPRGIHDPRGFHDPRGRHFRSETRDDRRDLRQDLRDADDRGDVRDARRDYRQGVRDEFWD